MSGTPLLDWKPPKRVWFDGPEYDPKHDRARLSGQILRVFAAMKDGRWRTVEEISTITGDPQPSISAQLRHLRKDRWGAFDVQRQSRGDRAHGLYEYRVLPPDPNAPRDHGNDMKQALIKANAKIRELETELATLRAVSP